MSPLNPLICRYVLGTPCMVRMLQHSNILRIKSRRKKSDKYRQDYSGKICDITRPVNFLKYIQGDWSASLSLSRPWGNVCISQESVVNGFLASNGPNCKTRLMARFEPDMLKLIRTSRI